MTEEDYIKSTGKKLKELYKKKIAFKSLEKEAYEESEKLKEYQTKPSNEYEKGFNNGEVRGYKDGYRDGAEKRIAELEAQIEKMKCCENCKYNSYWGNELHCDYGLKEALQEDILIECKDMNKWEIKEK